MTQSTYSDTDDALVSSIGNAFEAWVEFESYIFRRIDQDKSIARLSLLNVGAGRLVTGAELPFSRASGIVTRPSPMTPGDNSFLQIFLGYLPRYCPKELRSYPQILMSALTSFFASTCFST